MTQTDDKQIAPFGSWPSPIAAADLAVASPRIDGARFVGDEIWWSEGVASERGRTAIFRQTPTGPDVVLGGPWSARSRVHEYGGGAWTTTPEGELLFVEHSDQRVWALRPGAEPRALTPAGGGLQFGDLVFAEGHLFAVREVAHSMTPNRALVRIPLDGSAADDPAGVTAVVAGSDFVAYPCPQGDLFAWVSWDHPDMPWDAATLRVGRIGADGSVGDSVVVAGGPGVSALQPVWTTPGELTYVADPDGRWNLYRAHIDLGIGAAPGGLNAGTPVALAPSDADTGGPLWNLGLSWFAPLEDGRIVAVQTHGNDALAIIDSTTGAVAPVETELSSYVLLRDVRGGRVLLTGSGTFTPGALWMLDVAAPEPLTVVRGGPAIDASWLAASRPVTFTGSTGEVHAFDYPPTNPGVRGPEGELPPYLVLVHGGPTTHVSGDASAAVAFFTSRGIGVLDVNYGGSTGYGRAYRERLRGQWGVVDVDDVITAASGLAAAGLADRRRLAVKGGSAGGWTVLSSLVRGNTFAAGISRYGVADLRALAADTHDFEARYLDRLVGPLPEAEDVYIERSPLSHPDRLRVPVLILQGADDPVVPPAQSIAVRDALAARGIPHAYVEYDGESHGFRQASTITHAFESELSFLGQVLGFATPGVPVLPLE